MLDYLNKSTKIRLNYLFGITLSVILLWGIYLQVKKQLTGVDTTVWKQTGPEIYLWACIILMFVNVALEARKWQLLASSAGRLTYLQSLSSYLAGIAISIVTPNRIGEYPGRIIYLKRKNTIRLISVSVLGAFSQLLTIFIFGMVALIYYNIAFPGFWAKVALVSSFPVSILLAWCYWRFESWLPLLQKIKWAQRYRIYGQLLMRFNYKEQLTILGLSMLRFAVFTAQYLVLLHWMNVDLPLVEGFLLCALFFWVIAVVPSITLAELGIRGQVGLYLFQHFSSNTIGILSATIGIWLINLIVPAIFGCILLLRLRIFK